MKMRFQSIARLARSEEAVAAIEYALMGALIAVVIMGSLSLVGNKTFGFWKVVADCVDFATTGNGTCP